MRSIELRVGRHVRTAFDDDGSAVVLSMRHGQYVFLNVTAGYLWRLLTEELLSFEEALARTAARYRVAPERFREDLESVIVSLLKNRLLEERRVKS